MADLDIIGDIHGHADALMALLGTASTDTPVARWCS
jgi:hypothetical protein